MRARAFLLLAATLTAAAAPPTGDNVLVVVNAALPLSERIAEYYAGRRAIPVENVCRIRSDPAETIDRDVYDKQIAAPVRACIDEHPAPSRLEYMVTVKGVPLRIRGATGPDGTAAAVDSELALVLQQGENAPPLEGPRRNPFFGRYRQAFERETFGFFPVTRLTGYTFDDVQGLIDRAVEARNRGWFVLDQAPGKDKAGNDWLAVAARALPLARVRLDQSEEALYDLRGVIGYASWGSNDPRRLADDRRETGFEWLPGAIATAYVSTDGRTFEEPPPDWKPGGWDQQERFFAGSPQSLAADLIREGATGVSGHVWEPFLVGTPRPNYLFPAYFEGRPLAEAFYLAIPYLSWMNVVVGDPLCRLAL